VVSVQIVRNSIASATTNLQAVGCPAGTRVIGGGCSDDYAKTKIESSSPWGTRGWQCQFRDTQVSGMPLGFSAYAACLDERASAGVQMISNVTWAATSTTIGATCPAGKTVVGGGCIDLYTSTALRSSYPDPATQSWQCRFASATINGYPLGFEADAFCVDAATAASMGVQVTTATGPTAPAACPAGKRVVTGGCSDPPSDSIQWLLPDSQNHGWGCLFERAGVSAVYLGSTLSAVCVNE
jgi:hypothetical protein